MSCLLVQPEHLQASIDGRKWETRRLWDAPRVTVGKSYRLLPAEAGAMFTPRSEAPAYAVIEAIEEEPLGAIDAASADAEGGYTRAEFIEEWRAINGEWTPDETVYVVTYDTVETDPRADDGE